MSELVIRQSITSDAHALAEMIYTSTNYWYQTHGMGRIFSGEVSSASIFPEVYEDLDPGCCLVVEDTANARLAASCFYRVRPTHVSLGIMNAHPAYTGRGAARQLLTRIIEIANKEHKPLRLVSSALNLDSFSLYNRAGFVPRTMFQDMIVSVPINGIASLEPPGRESVRTATVGDLEKIVALERRVQGIQRSKDWAYFLQNSRNIWRTVVYENANGDLLGVLSSIHHPGCNMIGPGVAVHAAAMTALLWKQLDNCRGQSPVFLLPVTETVLTQVAYAWGAKNCELHVAQCRGEWVNPSGIAMPTFLPESA